MSPTMKDVAKKANLSLGTISNYVNGKKNVTEANQRKIELAIAELGYQVNAVARSLKTKSFHAIGVLVPTFKNVYIIRIVSFVEELLRQYDYHMVVSSYHNDSSLEKKLLHDLSSKVDGIIYVPSARDEEHCAFFSNIQKILPIVTLNEKLESVVCDSVLIDNFEIAYNATKKLIETGHRTIGFIAGQQQDYTTRKRVQGYKQAHLDLGIPLDNELIAYSDYGKSQAKMLCAQLLQTHQTLDSIFVVGNRMTLGVLSTLNLLALRDQITVLGFDFEDVADVIDVPICTVEQPCQQIASYVVQLILKRVQNQQDGFPTAIVLAAKLINEQSIKRK